MNKYIRTGISGHHHHLAESTGRVHNSGAHTHIASHTTDVSLAKELHQQITGVFGLFLKH